MLEKRCAKNGDIVCRHVCAIGKTKTLRGSGVGTRGLAGAESLQLLRWVGGGARNVFEPP